MPVFGSSAFGAWDSAKAAAHSSITASSLSGVGVDSSLVPVFGSSAFGAWDSAKAVAHSSITAASLCGSFVASTVEALSALSLAFSWSWLLASFFPKTLSGSIRCLLASSPFDALDSAKAAAHSSITWLSSVLGALVSDFEVAFFSIDCLNLVSSKSRSGPTLLWRDGTKSGDSVSFRSKRTAFSGIDSSGFSRSGNPLLSDFLSMSPKSKSVAPLLLDSSPLEVKLKSGVFLPLLADLSSVSKVTAPKTGSNSSPGKLPLKLKSSSSSSCKASFILLRLSRITA